MVSKMATQTDSDIQLDVMDEIRWDARLMATDIGVGVKNGVVSLSGWVDSYHKKIAAEEAAFRVRGTLAVANEIDVRLPSSAERTDAELAQTVLNALKWDTTIPTGTLEVTVSKGWVTIKGTVEYGYLKVDADRVVQRIAGVRGVTNQITIRSTLKPIDIKERIEKALVRNAQTDAQSITVETKEHHVILRGTVRSYAEKIAAEQTAWSAPGVRSIENNLIIQPF